MVVVEKSEEQLDVVNSEIYVTAHMRESARGCAHTSPHCPYIYAQSMTHYSVILSVIRRTTGRCLSCLTVPRLLEVDVGIAQRAPRDHIPTHADGQHRAGRTEFPHTA